ncbi:MAG: hypothetical protein GY870_09890 [archaeon]|nr:hypothetical protein [archaeon]
MSDWFSYLKVNPLPSLQKVDDSRIQYFIRKDLLDEKVESVETLWKYPEAIKILKQQLDNGAWPDKNKKRHVDSPENHQLVETYRNIGILTEFFGLNKNHPAVEKAIQYFFTNQTEEGDIRGIYGSQPMPNYCGGIMEWILKAGWTDDSRVDRVFQYFIDTRQDDGGWVLPHHAAGIKTYECEEVFRKFKIYYAKKSLPFAHMVTGNVVRAFANHPKWKEAPEAKRAGDLLITRFFKPDKYSMRQHADQWTKFSFPFWWTDLISVLDALSLMGYSIENTGIRRAVDYFKRKQLSDGSWCFSILKSKSHPNLDAWITLVLCRILKRIHRNV